MTLDELCPDDVGRRAIRLQPARLDPARAFEAFDLAVELDPVFGQVAAVVGLVLPLEMTVTSPSRSGFVRHVFRHIVPPSVSFIPHEGGPHLVRLRELGHNRYWGSYVVDVAGEGPARIA